MQTKVTQRSCAKLMRELLDRKAKFNLLDLANNRELFQNLQESQDIWEVLVYLEAKGFITLDLNPATHKLLRIHINNPGLTYFEDIFAQRRDRQVSWTQYIITTVISALALLLAILSILWQMYTWNVERSRSRETISDETQSVEVLTGLQEEQSQQHLE